MEALISQVPCEDITNHNRQQKTESPHSRSHPSLQHKELDKQRKIRHGVTCIHCRKWKTFHPVALNVDQWPWCSNLSYKGSSWISAANV